MFKVYKDPQNHSVKKNVETSHTSCSIQTSPIKSKSKESVASQSDVSFHSLPLTSTNLLKPILNSEYSEQVNELKSDLQQLTEEHNLLETSRNELIVEQEELKSKLVDLNDSKAAIDHEIEQMRPIVDEIESLLNSTS